MAGGTTPHEPAFVGRYDHILLRNPDERARARKQADKRKKQATAIAAWLEKARWCTNDYGRRLTVQRARSPECETSVEAPSSTTMKRRSQAVNAISNQSEQWEHLEPAVLPTDIRRRKPIGRRWVSQRHMSTVLIEQVGVVLSASLLQRIGADLSWLMDDAEVPSVWRLRVLQNGGAYLVPSGIEQLRLCRKDRRFDTCVSADAGGLCATMLSVNRIAHDYANRFQIPPARLRPLEQALAQFAALHPERSSILSVLD